MKSQEWLEMRDLLLQAPEEQLDKSVFPLIEAWGDDPASVQILEVLDRCVHSALASEFAVRVLQILLELKLGEEKKTLQDIVHLAVWRN